MTDLLYGDWRARVIDPGYMDPLSETCRLVIYQKDYTGVRYVADTNLVIVTGTEGTAPFPVGVSMPPSVLRAVGKAIAEWQGPGSDAATEAKILREWLAVERTRVERMLDR